MLVMAKKKRGAALHPINPNYVHSIFKGTVFVFRSLTKQEPISVTLQICNYDRKRYLSIGGIATSEADEVISLTKTGHEFSFDISSPISRKQQLDPKIKKIGRIIVSLNNQFVGSYPFTTRCPTTRCRFFNKDSYHNALAVVIYEMEGPHKNRLSCATVPTDWKDKFTTLAASHVIAEDGDEDTETLASSPILDIDEIVEMLSSPSHSTSSSSPSNSDLEDEILLTRL